MYVASEPLAEHAALMTCFVRKTEAAGHIHFIDGADCGYALAALDMKQRMAVGQSGNLGQS